VFNINNLTKEDIVLLKCVFDYDFNCKYCLIKDKCSEDTFGNIKKELLKKLGAI
jgi:hypothetical protein